MARAAPFRTALQLAVYKEIHSTDETIIDLISAVQDNAC